MKIKILAVILLIAGAFYACKKTDEVSPSKVSSVNATNLNVADISEENVENNFLDKGDNYGCVVFDPQTGSYVCDGTLCKRGPSRLCNVRSCQCISFKGNNIPLPQNATIIILDTKEKIEHYKHKIKNVENK